MALRKSDLLSSNRPRCRLATPALKKALAEVGSVAFASSPADRAASQFPTCPCTKLVLRARDSFTAVMSAASEPCGGGQSHIG